MTEIIVKDNLEGIEFFGAVDRTKDGKIASTAPSWYLRQHKDELDNEIRELEGYLDRELIHPSEKPSAIARLKSMKEKKEKIEEASPKFNSAQQDEIAKVAKDLGKKISESMFSKSDMMKGIADAHEEAHRMADPVIPLSDKEIYFAKKAGCFIDSKGRVSRNDAEKLWKLSSRAIGENSNSERLRKG